MTTVDPSAVRAQVMTFARDAALVLGAFSAASGFFARHDLTGFVAYLQSEPGLTAASSLLVLAVMAWRQLNARKVNKTLVAAAAYAPDDVLKVKQ